VSVTAVVVDEGVLRIEADRLVVVLDRSLELAFEDIGVRPVVERGSELGVELDRLVEVLDGPVGLGLLHIERAAVVVGRDVLRIKLYGLVIVLDGTLGAAFDPVGSGPVVVGDGEPGLAVAAGLDHVGAALDDEVRGRRLDLAGARPPFLGGGLLGRLRRGGQHGEDPHQPRHEAITA